MVVGCAREAAPPEIKTYNLPSGTSVSVRLASALNAGASDVGSPVLLVVDQPVSVDGATVIPKGSVVSAKVSKSRSEGTLSGLLNQPARLSIEIDSLAVNGIDIPVEFAEGKEFDFDRDNTSDAKLDVQQALSDPSQRAVLEGLAEALAKGQIPEVSDVAVLESTAQGLGLRQLETAAKGGKSSLNSLLSDLQSPAGIAKMVNGGQLDLALGAASEIIRLGDAAARGLGRALRGRTIRAPIGMNLTLRTKAATTIRR